MKHLLPEKFVSAERVFSDSFCDSSLYFFAPFFLPFSISFVASFGFSHTLFLTWMGWFAKCAGQDSQRSGQRSAQPPERETGHKLEVSSQFHHARSPFWIA